VWHPDKVLGESLMTHDESSKVLEQGNESFDLPPPLARFGREARTLAVLNHPNIATIYGLESQGLYVLVMRVSLL
jgi:hypothetical protein